MAKKCLACGAPQEGDVCDYCGHIEEKTEPISLESGNQQNEFQQQTVSPQIVINNIPGVGMPQFGGLGFVPGVSRKSNGVAFLLCLFLGAIGAHRFYVGKTGSGILYIFTLGFAGIGWLIDLIKILFGSFTDEFGLPLKW